ncbi:PepSY-associated TM helix domain-containing protein [Nostoc sp. NZL]|uniref:PepSY-associated TM helix domain-containing protein n=1 Tax=Nostoc sp. NZL TaxID=2650612 RepID=UPI002ED84D15|nr:PepSY domain-containing protein [Nostoc sp. NZL]
MSPQNIVEAVQKLYPNLKTHRITAPHQPDGVYTVMMVSPQDKSTDVYVNSYTGKILGSRPWEQTVIGFLITLHVYLFANDIGGQVVGICGIILLLMGITGIILWYRRGHIAQSLTIRWNAPWHLLNYDLHKVGGILSVVVLSLIAFTGSVMVFWTPAENAVYWLTNTKKPVEVTSKVVSGVSPMGIDAILTKAQAALPEAKIYKFFPAKKPEDTFNVWMHFPQENEFNKDPYLYFDQYTGDILRLDNPKQGSLANRIMKAQYTLHVGHYGGIVTKIVYTLIGLSPLGLFVTGVILWRNRQWVEARRKASRELVKKTSSTVG